jgi:hypothetical protein
VLVANSIAPAFSSKSSPERMANAVPSPMSLVTMNSWASRVNSAAVSYASVSPFHTCVLPSSRITTRLGSPGVWVSVVLVRLGSVAVGAPPGPGVSAGEAFGGDKGVLGVRSAVKAQLVPRVSSHTIATARSISTPHFCTCANPQAEPSVQWNSRPMKRSNAPRRRQLPGLPR